MKLGIKRLRSKFGLLGIALVGLSFLIFSIVLLTAEWKNMTQDIISEGELFARVNSSAIFSDYLNYYSNPADGMFEKFNLALKGKLSKDADVSQVSLIGVNGRILFDSKELDSGKYKGPNRFLEDPEALELVKEDVVFSRQVIINNIPVAEIYSPVIELSGEHVTSVRYTLSYDSRWQRIMAVVRQIVLAFIPAIILAVLLLIRFSLNLTRPITKLNRLTQEISQGKLEAKLEVESHDEIGQLASSFNQMISNLKKSRQESKNYSKNLAAQVEQRTEELRAQNQKLDKQNQSLEKLNRIMVGRETRIIELKKKNLSLQEQLEKK